MWHWRPISLCFQIHFIESLQWRHNEQSGVSNHQPHECLLNRFIQGADERKLPSSASLAFFRGIHQWPVNSLHKGPVTRKMFPFDDVIMLHAWIKSKWNIFHGWYGCVWTVLIDCGSGEYRTYFSWGDIDPFIVAYVVGLLIRMIWSMQHVCW